MKKSNSITTCMLLAVALGAAIIAWPQSGHGQERTAPDPNAAKETQPPSRMENNKAEQNSWAKYQIILQRNIFSRQRGPVRQRQAAQARPVITRNRESYLILKGIVQQDNIFIAFIEDTQNNSILKLHEGDSIARGVARNFTLDSIEYQLQDKTVSVTVGRDLEGGQGTLPISTLLQLSATSRPARDPNAPVKETTLTGDEAEILKKLMEQRKQQLGQ
jgi:hypothetical protein